MTHYKIFFALCISFLWLTGCTDNEIPENRKAGTTYLQIDIPRTDILSRTIGTPTTPGTEEENAISDITIYLTNNSRTVKIDNIHLTSFSSDSYTSDLIPIQQDMLNEEFQLFLVANPNKAGLDLRSTTDFKEVYSLSADAYRLVTPGQMVMSNQVEQSPVPTIIITKENTRENPATAYVSLDRLATKIEPQVSYDFDANFTDRPKEREFFSDYTFTAKGAGLLNAATEVNLEQLWSDGNGEPIQLLSPSWFYKPEAQYFNRYYNTLDDYRTDTPPFVSFKTTIENDFFLISSPFYCLENNSPFYDYTGSSISPEHQIKTKYKGLATGVIFKIQATLGDQPATFYSFEGLYYDDSAEGRLQLASAANLQPEDFNDITLLRGKDIRVYEDGYIYYAYWIKDINDAYSGEDYDLSYSIIRNSYYKLKILSVTDIGNDTPDGGYEPNEPIDKIEQIEIVAVAQDWTLVEVTHDFN